MFNCKFHSYFLAILIFRERCRSPMLFHVVGIDVVLLFIIIVVVVALSLLFLIYFVSCYSTRLLLLLRLPHLHLILLIIKKQFLPYIQYICSTLSFFQLLFSFSIVRSVCVVCVTFGSIRFGDVFAMTFARVIDMCPPGSVVYGAGVGNHWSTNECVYETT